MSQHTVLLVSPRRDVAEPIREATRSLKARTVHVADSHAALKCLQSMSVSVLIADESLPDGSGVALLERVQVAAPFAVRVLALDGGTAAEAAIDALNKGRASWFLQKPMDDTQAVSTILRRALTGYELEARSREAAETPQPVMQGRPVCSDDRAMQIEKLCTTGEMTGSLIHRFNNTLSIIMGHLELLLLDAGSKEIESRLEPVFQSASDSAELARTLQDFMRSSPATKELVNLNELVTDTLKMTEPVWRGSSRPDGDIDLRTNLGDVLPSLGNPSEIREILTNLVLNAVDAMPHGGTLTIGTDSVDGWVRITVADTGSGMSSAVQQRIFEPFYTTKGHKGNGLGLCIVRRIVREHGGDIRIESTPGKGSRFILLMPETAVEEWIRPEDNAFEAVNAAD